MNDTVKKMIMLGTFAAFLAAASIAAAGMEVPKEQVYTTDWLRMRTEQSLEADIAAVLSPGTKVTRTAALDNGWSCIIWNNQRYYMYSEYLAKHEPEKGITEKSSTFHVTASEFRADGAEFWGNYRWKYCPESELKNTCDPHHENNGFLCDRSDFIILVTDSIEEGTIVPTPFGRNGVIYSGASAEATINVYVKERNENE